LLLGTRTWPVNVNGPRRNLSPPRTFQANSGLALLSAALVGVGIAMLLDFIADGPISRGQLVRLLPQNEPPPTPVQFVRAPGGRTPRKLEVLTELLIQHFAAQRAPVQGGDADVEQPSSDVG
jgi:DNA-binding transcriptional LysR family regulator